MSLTRWGTANRRRTVVVCARTSPYGSRRLVVECDGRVTTAELRDARGDVVGAVWVAAHRPAPPIPEQPPGRTGAAPLLPASHTVDPDGRPPLDPSDLDVVWFEEGDGVAVLEGGEPLFVLPGWSDVRRGIPGYSRAVRAQSPYAFPLADELAEFAVRVERARAHWRLHDAEGSWEDFQGSLLGHLLARLGPGGRYWHDLGRRSSSDAAAIPTVGLSERPPIARRDHTVLSTVGMSRQRMPAVELYSTDVPSRSRVELAAATRGPAPNLGRVFPWLVRYPWRNVTSFASGDIVRWTHRDRPFPLGDGWDGVLLLGSPEELGGPVPTPLDGLNVDDDPVRWLWVVPVTAAECGYARDEGPDALIRRLARRGRSWVQ